MNVFVEFLITILLSAGVGMAIYVMTPRLLTSESFARLANPLREWIARRADSLCLLLVASFIIVFGSLAVVRFLAFTAGDVYINASWDLGQYDQMIWNSLRGRLLENTFIPDAPNFLGKSFSPILLALVPFYAVWSHPIVLLVLQAIGLGVAALPIYWRARARLGHLLALALVVAYVLSPGVVSISLNQFHEIAFATPLLAFMMFFLLRRRYDGFFVCLVLGLLLKEEIAFVVIAFGAYIVLVERRARLGLALMLFGTLWAFLLLQYVIPFFRGAEYGSSFYYFGDGVVAGGAARYSYLGRSLPEVFVTLLTRPDIVLTHLLLPDKIAFVLHFLVPLALTPLIGAEVVILALPTLGYSLLSSFDAQYSIWYSYFAPMLPFYFFAASVGIERALKWLSLRGPNGLANPIARQGALVAMVLVASVCSYYFHAPGPGAQHFQPERYVLSARHLLGNALIATVPEDKVAVTQFDLLAHLSRRRWVYEIPWTPDYRFADYLVADTTSRWYDVHRGYWQDFLATGYFEIVSRQEGYLIARRITSQTRLQIKFGDHITLLGYTLLPSTTWTGGMTVRPVAEWRVDQAIAERYVVTLRVKDARGHVWASDEGEPLGGHHPTSAWLPGKSVGDQYSLALPPTIPSGEYQIVAALHPRASDDSLEASDSNGNALGGEAAVATVQVAKNKASFTASQLQIEQPFQVDMREMRLLGFVPPRATIAPGELLQAGLYWRARSKPQSDYVVAVQLRDASERVVFEHAARPANNTYPTTEWDAGEVLLDWHDFELPAGVAPGIYQIVVVLRDAATGAAIGETLISAISVVD